MAKAFKPQIVTGNDLMSGDVIYLTPEHDWSGEHGDAAVAASQEAADALLAAAAAQPAKVVGPYLAGADVGADGRPTPNHFREAIRTRGPSFRTDLGKQADRAVGGGE